jgi:thiol-disulfide isomerase/thioredoxin
MDVVGLVAVGAVLAAGAGIGLWRRRNDGRLRSTSPAKDVVGTGRGAAGTGKDAAGTGKNAVATGKDAAGTGKDPAGVAVEAARAGRPAAEPRSVVTPDVEETPADIAEPAHDRLDPGLLAALGIAPARATLLQFSSAFCAPCRAVRRVSSEVATLLPDVQHVDVDAESHLDAVRALNVWRTPTLFVLDADGRVAKRATGVPSKPQLIAALAEVLPAPDSAPGQR